MYKITRDHNNDSATLKVCVERTDISKVKIKSQILNVVSLAFKLNMLTFVLDPLSPYIMDANLTQTLYGVQSLPEGHLFSTMFKVSSILFIAILLCKKSVENQILKEEVIIVKEFGVQLNSFALGHKLINQRFIDIARIRDFVLNEVCSIDQN